ncbi:MAG: Crp/Fnr family transcriptional regulator [Acidimicrobiia bacterium]
MDMKSQADDQHLDWLARSFGRPEYLPLTTSDLEVLIRSAELVSKYPGTHLFKEGEDATTAFLVESGEVEIYRGTESGRRVVSRSSAGSLLGDVAMLRDLPHLASAQAVSRVRAFALERDLVLPVLADHPELGLRWLVGALSRMEETQRRVLHLIHKTVLSQVADLLLEESGGTGEVYLSQTTVATLLGVSRQSVNEALGRLKDQQIVETGYRHIRVVDGAKLAVVSDS